MVSLTRHPPVASGSRVERDNRDQVRLPPIGLSEEVDQAISRVAYEVSRRLWLERHCPFAQ
jgi:hypothetical protein